MPDMGAPINNDDLQYRGYTCWERANYPDKAIIGVRKMPDGSLQFLMHNEALCSPYYLATDGHAHARLD